MNTPSTATGAPTSAQAPPAAAAAAGLGWPWLFGVVTLLALAGLVWQRLESMQEQLARQSADAGAVAKSAHSTAQRAYELATETAAKLAVAQERLSEVSVQRGQLEELVASLSRSRDENLVVDLESALRLGQQQAQLTGSAEPLVAALQGAQARLERAAQPRLGSVARALASDIARIQDSARADTPALVARLDAMVPLVDALPLANAPVLAPSGQQAEPQADSAPTPTWQRLLERVRDGLLGLVRVGRIENPDAVLVSAEQAFFLRENLKLQLLNARLSLLSRQSALARLDLATVAAHVGRYFDVTSRQVKTLTAQLRQVQNELRSLQLPQAEESLAALSAAAAGR